MTRTRIQPHIEGEVIYTEEHWQLLKMKREYATRIISLFLRTGSIQPYLFGSVARGDIHKNSDIELIIFEHNLLPHVEILLSNNCNIIEKEIILATPRSTLKAAFRLDYGTEVVVPITPFTQLDYEFYRYGGLLDPKSVSNYRLRTLGVDKRLCMIIPTPKGHKEFSIIGRETEVARLLGVSPEIIEERKKILMKRDLQGRTGVYLRIRMDPNEDISRAIKRIADRDPAIRRLLKLRRVKF